MINVLPRRTRRTWSDSKGIAYHPDLFDEALLKAFRPDGTSNGGTDACPREGSQMSAAFERQRALTTNLMEQVASSANLNQACKRVKANKGAAGTDRMSVSDLRAWLADHKDELAVSLVRGEFIPSPVLGVQIPKPGGGVRQLGIPTAVDRLVQQAILQVLQPILDPTFSDSSFGFRPGRGAHDALIRARGHVAAGYVRDRDRHGPGEIL